ncbi:MAG: hypothetical protein NTU97_01625, partial [Candidatus Magasanikbacteria bacterium]|nr:hypothetical protein [Candidatus Magasanikbacteria bacterium]
VALDKIGKLGVLGGGMATGASSWMKNTAKTGLKKYAIPAALTAYTGGGILTAMGMRAGLKAGIGTAQGLPLVGGAFKALAKEGDKYGLASEKGLGGYAGRKGAGLISQGKEAVLTRISRTGIGGVLVGTAARGAAATMKSERLKTARDAEKHVSEYKDEDVIKAAKGKGLTSEGQSEKLAAIGRILGESKLKKQVSDGDLQEMIGALPKLGEDLGKGKEVDGLLKGFYKENPELRMSTPATGTKPAKSRGEYIEEDLRGMSPDAATKMSVKSLKDEEVVEHMSKEQIKKVFSDGDEERQLALAGTILKKETGGTLDHDKLDNPSNPANQADINTALQGLMTSGRIGALPKGIFDAMPLVFAQLNADLQKTLLDEKLFSNPSKEHFVDGSGDPTDKGKKLAMEVAESGKDDLIKELQIKVGAEFGKALKEAVGDLTASGGRPDPRVANILASLQTTSTAMLTEARKASGTGGLGASVKGQDAYKWIKKLKHSDLVNSSGTATPEGLEIVQNISVSNLSRVIQEAGASGSPQMKEMAGSLTALVEKAMVVAAPGVTPPPGSVVVSDKVRKGLDDLLKEPSTVGAIDWLSKGGLNLR